MNYRGTTLLDRTCDPLFPITGDNRLSLLTSSAQRLQGPFASYLDRFPPATDSLDQRDEGTLPLPCLCFRVIITRDAH